MWLWFLFRYLLWIFFRKIFLLIYKSNSKKVLRGLWSVFFKSSDRKAQNWFNNKLWCRNAPCCHAKYTASCLLWWSIILRQNICLQIYQQLKSYSFFLNEVNKLSICYKYSLIMNTIIKISFMIKQNTCRLPTLLWQNPIHQNVR